MAKRWYLFPVEHPARDTAKCEEGHRLRYKKNSDCYLCTDCNQFYVYENETFQKKQ